MDEREKLLLKKDSARIRAAVLKMLVHAGYGHLGGAMSIVELMSVLYNKVLRYDPADPAKADRDYVVLSKGHAGPAWYAALALHGFFDPELLLTLNQGGTCLPSHPDRLKTPGVDATTGSLGQGTSVAAGLGVGIRCDAADQKVYLITGDGELNEGQCWEAFQFLAHQRMHEVIVIIDNNKRQLDGRLEDIIEPFDIAAKMEAFGFRVFKADGRDEASLAEALAAAGEHKGSAVCVIMDTVKGQGCRYYEDKDNCHSPRFDEKARAALEEEIKELEAFAAKEGQ